MPTCPVEPVARVKKNAVEEVRVAWSDFNGGTYLDVRVYTTDGPEPKPTKKGLCLTPEVWRELLPVIAGEVGADDSRPDAA